MNRNCFSAAQWLLAFSLFAASFSCSPVASPIPSDSEIDTTLKINTLLDQNTDSVLSTGNSMKLLVDGPVSRQAYRDLISSATDHINIEMWDIDDDSAKAENIGQEFVDLLVEKAQAGVLVNLILDPIAMEGYSSPAMIDQLQNGGVNVRLFMPPLDKILLDQLLYRTHKKFMVVDGKAAILGGMNFGYDYMGEGQWRDTNVQLSGPVVAETQRMFLQDWATLGDTAENESRYFPELDVTGSAEVRIIDQRPCEDDFDINETIRIILRSAKNNVDIEAPYFNPMSWLKDELYQTVQRGVRVRILTNSKDSIDVGETVYNSMAANFQSMIDNGVEIYLWNSAGHTLHSKCLTVDDQFAWVSSFNFNYRSLMWDTECVAAFTDSESVGAIQQMIDNDFSHDFVIQVTQDWIDSQGSKAQAQWRSARVFRYITKEISPE